MQRLSSSSPNLAQSTRDALMELLNEPALRERLEQACPAAYCDGELKLDLLMEEMGKYVDLGDEERYEFRWNGKQRAKQLAQTPSTCTLRPCPEESKNWDTTQNLYIEGDNLEVLKILQRAYSGKIKMIYIDPPYNTGHDFVYKDDFSDSLVNYLKQTGAVDDAGKLKSSNTAADGRYHTNWLNMMYPRLRLAKNLLTEDGVIFISIDDNEQANLKKLCDEVFGSENFRNIIITRRRVKSLNNQFSEQGLKSLNVGYEYIFVYSKTERFLMNAIRVNKEIEVTKGRWDVFWSNADRPTMRYELLGFTPETGQWRNSKEKALTAVNNYIIYLNNYAEKLTLEEYSKKTGITEFIRRIPSGVGKNGGVQHWIAPSNTTLRTSNWLDLEVSQISKEIELPFDNPKNKLLLMELIKLVPFEKDSIILDFFSGSATTAHAVMQLNAEDGGKRKFIMVQLPEVCDTKSEAAEAGYKNICEIGKERIRRAGEKVVSDQLSAVSSGKPSAVSSQRSVFGDQPTDHYPLTTNHLDIGYKVFKLADSNMNKWKLELADLSNKSEMEKAAIEGIMAATNTIRRKEIEAENEQRREAGLAPFDIDLCVVYEWLLKYGVQLDKRVEVATVAGKRVYMVSGGAFMICLDDGLDQNWAQALVAERDKRIGSLGATTVSDMWHVMVADASFTANNLLNVEHYLTANGLKGEHFIVV